jgi:uncharacterized protein (DUF427 family)
LEEEEEIKLHPKNPWKGVDALQSSRHVEVFLAGKKVHIKSARPDFQIADTKRPVLLFETGVPVRYYIPQEDVKLNLLEPSEFKTYCPYKGDARYWNVCEA